MHTKNMLLFLFSFCLVYNICYVSQMHGTNHGDLPSVSGDEGGSGNDSESQSGDNQ